MDSSTPQQRHANMAAIHGKDTKPEMVVGNGCGVMGIAIG